MITFKSSGYLDNTTLCVSLSLIIRIMRLTRYISSNSQLSYDVFLPLDVSSGTAKLDEHHIFLAEILVDRNGQGILDLQ